MSVENVYFNQLYRAADRLFFMVVTGLLLTSCLLARIDQTCINSAITRLSRTMQQNAVASERLAATSTQMRTQAAQPQEAMGFFIVVLPSRATG